MGARDKRCEKVFYVTNAKLDSLDNVIYSWGIIFVCLSMLIFSQIIRLISRIWRLFKLVQRVCSIVTDVTFPIFIMESIAFCWSALLTICGIHFGLLDHCFSIRNVYHQVSGP